MVVLLTDFFSYTMYCVTEPEKTDVVLIKFICYMVSSCDSVREMSCIQPTVTRPNKQVVICFNELFMNI